MIKNISIQWKFSAKLCFTGQAQVAQYSWMYQRKISGQLEQHALTLKNRVALKFFTVLNITFTFRSFEQLALALKKQSCPENFRCIHSGVLSSLRLPWKTELLRNFSLYWIHFLHTGILRNLRLPWETEFALKFFQTPPPCTPMQADLGSQTIRSGTVAFKALRCVIEVAYVFASVKAITVKFLWEHNTQGTSTPWVNKQGNYRMCQ